jgi:hypothetical protein
MDARKFLENAEHPITYDFIFIDAFRDGGDAPCHLATKEFYWACKMRLSPGGVVTVNLVESDPMFGARLATIADCFETIYVQIDRTTVVFCVDAPPIPRDDLMRRAESIQQAHNFGFDFTQRASTVRLLEGVESLQTLVQRNAVLTDFESSGLFAGN